MQATTEKPQTEIVHPEFVRFEEVKAALRHAIARAERLAQRLRELGVEENSE